MGDFLMDHMAFINSKSVGKGNLHTKSPTCSIRCGLQMQLQPSIATVFHCKGFAKKHWCWCLPSVPPEKASVASPYVHAWYHHKPHVRFVIIPLQFNHEYWAPFSKLWLKSRFKVLGWFLTQPLKSQSAATLRSRLHQSLCQGL